MTARDLRRSSWLPDPWEAAGVLALLVLASLVLGCGPVKKLLDETTDEEKPFPAGKQSPHVAAVTTSGVTVTYPIWLDWPQNASHRTAMFREVAETKPDADPRIDPALRGVLGGAHLAVLDGRFYVPGIGLATGQTVGNVIFLAWRPEPVGLRLPALGHELRHYYTGDPLAGH